MSTTNMSLGLGSAPRNLKTAVATAKQINEQHRLAIQSAENAIEHAILCGQMLVEKKASLAHGELQPWIEKNCEFAYSTAARYMKAAQSSKAVNLSALRQIFPSGNLNEKPKLSPKLDSVQISTAVEICEKTAAEKAPFLAPQQEKIDAPKPAVSGDPERPDDIDEDAALAAAEADYARRVDRVMGSDDALGEAHAQIKQQSSLIGTLEMSRDGYMHGKEQITKMLQAEQRKTARLEKENQKLRDEVQQLRERIAAMESA